MALSDVQVNQVLKYKSFDVYSLAQKEVLRKRLLSSGLILPQIALLFGDGAGSGMIHELIEAVLDKNDDVTVRNASRVAAQQLSKVIVNANDSLGRNMGVAPIIKNMLGSSGNYSARLADAVAQIVKAHATIYRVSVVGYVPEVPQAPEHFEADELAELEDAQRAFNRPRVGGASPLFFSRGRQARHSYSALGYTSRAEVIRAEEEGAHLIHSDSRQVLHPRGTLGLGLSSRASNGQQAPAAQSISSEQEASPRLNG